MPRLRAAPTPAESLMRWLAGWLAVALLAQVGAAAVLKPSHRHGSAPESKPMLLWRHAADGVRNDSAVAHARAHLAGEPHQHPIDDASVLPMGADAASEAAAQAAAFGLAPAPRTGTALMKAMAAGRDWVAGTPWVPTARAVSPLRRPPRA